MEVSSGLRLYASYTSMYHMAFLATDWLVSTIQVELPCLPVSHTTSQTTADSSEKEAPSTTPTPSDLFLAEGSQIRMYDQ